MAISREALSDTNYGKADGLDISSPARTRSVALLAKYPDDRGGNHFYELYAFKPYPNLPAGATGFVVLVSVGFNSSNPSHGLLELGGRILDAVYGRLDSSL